MPFNSTSGSGTVPYYGGGQVPNPANVIQKAGAPSAAAVDPALGTLYVDTTANAMYALVDKTGAVATWALLGGGSSDVNTLTPDSGTSPVVPVGGTITLAGGTGVSTVGGANSMTFNVVGGGLKTTVSAATPSTVAINTRLVPNTGGLYTANMPAVAAVGSVIQITGNGAGGWLLQCGAGQTINSSGGSTSSGGSLASTNRYDSIRIVCVVANTTWTIEAIVGALTNA